MDPDAVFSTLVRDPASIGRERGALTQLHEALNLKLKRAGLTTTPTQFFSYVAMAATADSSSGCSAGVTVTPPDDDGVHGQVRHHHHQLRRRRQADAGRL